MKIKLIILLLYSLNAQTASDESQELLFQKFDLVVDKSWKEYEANQSKGWDDYQKNVEKTWKDIIFPSEKFYVDYYDNYKSRVKIDFEEGKVKFEIIDTLKQSKSAINSLILEGLERNKDLLDGQISFNNYLLNQVKSLEENIDGQPVTKYEFGLNMVPNHVKVRANKYIPLIKHWSSKNSLPPELVLAIMWQESAFNPKAVSHIPAFGLMQIVPKYAGLEVKSFLGENEIVNGDFLYNPDNNIRYGTSYLRLLSQKYFTNIKPFENRAPFMIAGYNWGPNRLLKHLEKGTIKISSPKKIQEQIISIAPQETKGYLSKVIEKWKKIESDKWVSKW